MIQYKQFLYWQRLVSNEHYAAAEVTERRVDLNERRDNLSSSSKDRRDKLESSYSYQLFERDCDESMVWISEKLKIANDENYKDPTNLQGILYYEILYSVYDCLVMSIWYKLRMVCVYCCVFDEKRRTFVFFWLDALHELLVAFKIDY